MTYFQASSAIKIRLPSSLTKGYWAIEEQLQKTTYAVPFLAALMTVACSKPTDKNTLLDLLSSKIAITSEQFEKTLASLMAKKIILPTDESPFANINKWKKAGWDDAADYHFFTWDAPFLDYSKEGQGHDIDRKKMIDYQALQSDTERFKKYEGDLFEMALPSLDFPLPGIELLSVVEKIKYLLACVLGQKGEKACHWSDTPLIRRTSPSGGSRHPTEGYFITGNIHEMEQGFYHIQTYPTALRLLSTGGIDILETFISKPISSSTLGAVVLTTVFERNMYRYREPRTFRTVHMDIGHILASIEALGYELGLKVTVHLQLNEEPILKRIGTSKLKEGVMAMVTIQEVR